jgi:mycothiol synthase
VSDLTIRACGREDDERYVAMLNAIVGERAPQTLEEHRHFVNSLPARSQYGELVAEKGEVVGHVSWARRIYTTDKDTFWLDILVDRDLWGRGIGSALDTQAMQRLRDLGARKVYVHAREDIPEGERFAARRGFVPTGHGDRISKLDVRHANLERSQEAAKRVEASGIRIATLADLTVDDHLLEALRALDEETSRDIPGEENHQAGPLEEWKQWLDEPGMRPDTFWLAMDGERPVAMAPLQIRTAGFADNAYTCVARSYRGRGIARALKLRGIEWARENGVHSIVTGNDPANEPMLAVNIDLGYQMLPRYIEMVKTLS